MESKLFLTVLDKIIFLLEKHDQKHLIPDLDGLDSQQKDFLLEQLQNIDLQIRENFPKKEQSSSLVCNLSALESCEKILVGDSKLGRKFLSSGKMGCILLAGGEGSRLGFSKPKGMFPLVSLNNKSLFQVFVEKIRAAQNKYQKKFYLALMVNPFTAKQIYSFFEDHHFFGLDKTQIDFFCQEMLPYFDGKGRWRWSSDGKIAVGTEGNGKVFHHFYKSPIYKKWIRLGIKQTSVIPIDNPLAKPFDLSCLGMHLRKDANVTITCIPTKKDKKMGGLVLENGKIKVLEYFYLKDKNIPIYFSNIGIYLIKIETIEQLESRFLPLHKVEKKIPKSQCRNKNRTMAFKHEIFIFDAFYSLGKVCCFESKSKYFVPLKDKCDITKVNNALLSAEKNLIKKLVKKPPKLQV